MLLLPCVMVPCAVMSCRRCLALVHDLHSKHVSAHIPPHSIREMRVLCVLGSWLAISCLAPSRRRSAASHSCNICEHAPFPHACLVVASASASALYAVALVCDGALCCDELPPLQHVSADTDYHLLTAARLQQICDLLLAFAVASALLLAAFICALAAFSLCTFLL